MFLKSGVLEPNFSYTLVSFKWCHDACKFNLISRATVLNEQNFTSIRLKKYLEGIRAANAVLLATALGELGNKGNGMEEVWVVRCLGEGLEGIPEVVGGVSIPDGTDLGLGLMGTEELRE